MGTTCSNCNCNKDERDELKIDEKGVVGAVLSSGHGNVVANRGGQGPNEQVHVGSSIAFGAANEGYDGGKINMRNNNLSYGMANNSGLDPTATFDEHHYTNKQNMFGGSTNEIIGYSNINEIDQ